MESIRDDVTKDGKDSHIEMRRREGLQATCAGEFKKARAFEPDPPSTRRHFILAAKEFDQPI